LTALCARVPHAPHVRVVHATADQCQSRRITAQSMPSHSARAQATHNNTRHKIPIATVHDAINSSYKKPEIRPLQKCMLKKMS
jgi:hypothetical protein